MRFIKMLTITLVANLFVSLGFSQESIDPAYKIQKASERPDLTVIISSVAKLKIGLRKKAYRLGEMLTVDAAILSTTESPVFVPSIKSVSIFVGDKIIPYSITYRTTALSRMAPRELETVSVSYVIGCSETPFKILTAKNTGLGSTSVFENDLFVSWGQGCINVTDKTSLKIHAELSNEQVVISDDSSNTKSAVGRLNSPALEIMFEK